MSEEYIREEFDIIKKSTEILNNIGCTAGPKIKTDIYTWNVLIKGPKNSCYEKGLFHLTLIFPKNYPTDPPDIKFDTKIYHPNISIDDGRICVSSKSTEWDKNKTIIDVLYSIYDLLNKPNIDHGLNKEALLLYKNDKEGFIKKAKEFTEKNALAIINEK